MEVGQAAEERYGDPVDEKVACDDPAKGNRPQEQGVPDLGQGDGQHGAVQDYREGGGAHERQHQAAVGLSVVGRAATHPPEYTSRLMATSRDAP